MSKTNEEWSITYKQLGIVLISFVLGLIVALLISNSQISTTSNFTTTELIGFVMSVILSGASIVLAIAAITLGKSSEQAVINRSDESMRLQTEVFTKTTNALQAIKASTDVTEKRIEDIISGRAGELSKQIAELATDEADSSNIDVKELEEKIRKSLTLSFDKKNEPSEAEKEERIKRRNESRSRRLKYDQHHDSLILGLANKPDVKIEKMGHGNPSAENSSERYDAILNKNGKRVAISTIVAPRREHYPGDNHSDYLHALAIPLEKENIDRLILVLFKDDIDVSIDSMIEAKALMKDDIASRIEISAVAYEDLEEWSNQIKI